MKRTLFLLALPALVSSVPAATLSFSYGLPLIESITEINETGSLGTFDSNLGTLTGATLEVYGSLQTQITLTNTSAVTVMAQASGETQITWSSPLGPLNALLPGVNGGTMVLTFTTGNVESYAPGQSRTFGPFADNDTFSYDLATILSSLQAPGGGTFSLNASSLSGLSLIGGGGALQSTQNSTAGSGARISYTYTPVPEPSASLLLALGLYVPLAWRRRK